MYNWSSRLALYRASPSAEPDMWLSRIQLPAKLIVQQLSFIDFHIYSRLRKWAGFQHLIKVLSVVAFLLASSVPSVVQALPYLKAEVGQCLGIVCDSVVMIISNKYLIHFRNNLPQGLGSHFRYLPVHPLHFFANFFLLVFLFTLNFPFLLLEQ